MFSNNRLVSWWLTLVATMVFFMVLIGGITRLTDSGLSMVDWRPIMGVLPPMNQQEWQETFQKYQSYPEYQKINQDMDLEGFKRIFFWEYFHRLFGRLLGVVFFIPFALFVAKKQLSPSQIKKYSIAFILGGSQGLLGWYMVQSGLVSRPDVSHYRLAAHLLLALTIIGYLYWLILELKFEKRQFTWANRNTGSVMSLFFLLLLIIQILYGAFVAGLDACLLYTSPSPRDPE